MVRLQFGHWGGAVPSELGGKGFTWAHQGAGGRERVKGLLGCGQCQGAPRAECGGLWGRFHHREEQVC